MLAPLLFETTWFQKYLEKYPLISFSKLRVFSDNSPLTVCPHSISTKKPKVLLPPTGYYIHTIFKVCFM